MDQQDQIRCPNCGHEQEAIVQNTYPWPTYVHECTECEYIITESEWISINEEQDATNQ